MGSVRRTWTTYDRPIGPTRDLCPEEEVDVGFLAPGGAAPTSQWRLGPSRTADLSGIRLRRRDVSRR